MGNEGLDSAWQATLAERWAWIKGLCDAVRHCHRLRVLHRDINPWNVFLVASGVGAYSDAVQSRENAVRFLPRLGDFGLSVQLKSVTQELHGWCSEDAVPLDESAITSLYS